MDEAVDMNEFGGTEQLLAQVSKTLGSPEAPAVSAPGACEECREKSALSSFRVAGRTLCVDCFKLHFKARVRAVPVRIASRFGRFNRVAS